MLVERYSRLPHGSGMLLIMAGVVMYVVVLLGCLTLFDSCVVVQGLAALVVFVDLVGHR